MKTRKAMTKRSEKLTLLSLLLSSAYLPVYAQSNIITLPTTNAYDGQTASEKRQTVLNSMVVIDQENIERFNDVTAGDMLRRLPGISFEGPPGENKDVRVRGLDKGYSQVLINGRRVPDAGKEREFQVDQIPVQLIERIEIIRAPTADMDAQGIGGTINIVLKSTPDKDFLSITAGISQLEGADVNPNLNINYGGRSGDIGYLLNFNAKKRGLIKSVTDQKFNGDGDLEEIVRGTEDQEFTEYQFAPSVYWDLSASDKFSLETLLLVSNEDKIENQSEFDDENILDAKESEEDDKQRFTWSLHGQWDHQYGNGNEFSLGLTTQRTTSDVSGVKTEFDNDGSVKEIKKEDEDKSDRELILSVKNKYFIGEKHNIVSGLEFTDKTRVEHSNETTIEDGEVNNEINEADQYNLNEKRISAYILDEYKLSERQLLTPGIRFEWTDTEISNGDNVGSNADYLWVPSLHYLFTWMPDTNIRASVTKTTRRPKFGDLSPFVEFEDGTIDEPDETGNPDLEPEVALGFDIGVDHFFANQAGNISLNAFYRDIDDKIETRTSLNQSSGRYEKKPENIGTAKLQGLELDTRLHLVEYGFEGLTLSGNVTLLDSEVTDQDTGIKTKFKGNPDYLYNIGFDHHISSIDMNWGMNLNQVGKITSEEIKDDALEIETTESQQFLDLYIKKSFTNGIVINFSAQNLLSAERDKRESSFNVDGSLDEFERKVDSSERMINLSITAKW